MKKQPYIYPQAISVNLHDTMQVTVISGVADEDSLAPRFPTEEDFFENTNFWYSPFEDKEQ